MKLGFSKLLTSLTKDPVLQNMTVDNILIIMLNAKVLFFIVCSLLCYHIQGVSINTLPIKT